MADIDVLMVTDGSRFNFGTQPPVSNPDFFGLSAIVAALRGSTTPTINVDTAHRRGATFSAANNPDPSNTLWVDTSVNLTYSGDFLFTSIELEQYDVIWLIGDEGYNGGALGTTADKKLGSAEWTALATFMQQGGGLFAVGDHDGIGQYMCGMLPRVRVMRRWFFSTNFDSDPTFAQFVPNWSSVGTATSTSGTDRFDTLQPDSLDGNFYFVDQSDPIPQPLKTGTGALLSASGTIHSVLRAMDGTTIANFPDHMHEGEATDFASVSSGVPFEPNDSHGNPNAVAYTNAFFVEVVPSSQAGSFVEFPIAGGFQPQPEVVAYGTDSGHGTYLQGDGPPSPPSLNPSNPKTRGVLSVYDGYAAGVGRVMTGSTFHHYMNKNLVGDPLTQSTTPGVGPTGSNLGLQLPDFDGSDPSQPSAISSFYINAVTWLARPRPNFYFLTAKNTFGSDESQDGGIFSDAFYVVLEGFAPSVVGNPAIALSGPFKDTLATFQQQTAIFSGSATTPQRILFPFTVSSIPAGAFPAPTQPPKTLVLEAGLTVGTTPFACEALFELIPGADPFFTNVDPTVDNEFYLSEDLRVVQVTPGFLPIPFGLTFPSGPDAGFIFVQSLLAYLNDAGNGFRTQGGADPFATLAEHNDLTEASSIVPSVLVFPNVLPSYNFAIARVRIRGSAPATDVRVFFRMFATQTNDTDYAPETTYLSVPDAAGLPNWPLPGTGGTSFPFFASAGGPATDYPGPNEQSSIAGDGSQNETWTYFGCYLNVYDMPASTFPGTHHCLVAQIAYDAAPIVNSNGITLSPENSDKLAQRNIQITPSGNPGGPLAHRVPQTFDLRPSVRSTAKLGSLAGYPDELMIDWGRIPAGSVASIYWPQAPASEIVRLAILLYASDGFSVVDEHTVRFSVANRTTYVPIPFGTGPNFAGLLTIDLPEGVKKGGEFEVVVRRVRTRGTPQHPTNAPAQIDARAVRGSTPRDWRYVVGTFQVTIPVSTEETLLLPEENTLAIMKWRLQHTAATSRWHPVLERYVAYLAGRVTGFGGDPGTIVPSPTGVPLRPGKPSGPGAPGRAWEECTGKVCEVIFDCFGDFEGFVLDTCSARQRFFSREKQIGTLVLRACKERFVLSVFFAPGGERRIRRLVVRE